MITKSVLVAIAAYLVGSIPFGYMVAKIGYGIDIRDHGSKNIGFTNVLRTLGPVPGTITLIADILKGVVAVTLARFLTLPDASIIIAGLAVIAGHNWSVFLRFRAGRGVATGLGVVLALTWQPTLILVALWAVILLITRYVSVASIIAVAMYPVLAYLLKLPAPYVIMGVIGAAAIIWQHRENIKRLIRGEENKLGKQGKSEGNGSRSG